METIKISVEVSVNLSENTQKFLTSLFAAGVPSGAQVAASVSKPAAPAASSASKSIEDVRGMLAKKVNEHRDVIKQKLNELGAPSVTKLDPAKYDEVYNFLESL